MTREQAIKLLRKLRDTIDRNNKYGEAEEMAIQALEQEPSVSEIPNNCEMRDATLEERESIDKYIKSISKPTGVKFEALEQEPKKCKDCKWWRDSDGYYRRGVFTESKCPINRKEVFEGNGYCYMFEPQESEDKE